MGIWFGNRGVGTAFGSEGAWGNSTELINTGLSVLTHGLWIHQLQNMLWDREGWRWDNDGLLPLPEGCNSSGDRQHTQKKASTSYYASVCLIGLYLGLLCRCVCVNASHSALSAILLPSLGRESRIWGNVQSRNMLLLGESFPTGWVFVHDWIRLPRRWGSLPPCLCLTGVHDHRPNLSRVPSYICHVYRTSYAWK